MALEKTASEIWDVREVPLAALVASHGNAAFHAKLPAALQAPFAAASIALRDWYPARAITLNDLYATALGPCLDAYAALDEKSAKQRGVHSALGALYLQLLALERATAKARTLPSDCYHTGPDEFVALVAALPKLEAHLTRRQLEKRLELLLARATARGARWADVRDAADRQGWGRLGAPLAGLPPRTRELAEEIDLGATVEPADAGGRVAYRVTCVDGSRRVAVLDDAERSALSQTVPWAL